MDKQNFNELKGHDPLVDKTFRTLKITGKTAKLTTTKTDDQHTAMLAYKEYLNPPQIEKDNEPDWSKVDPLFAPADYIPPKKAGGKRVAEDPDNPKYKAKNDRVTLKEREESLLEIGRINFNKENSTFVTLTFANDGSPCYSDLTWCKKVFSHFIRNMKNYYSGLAYIVVFETNRADDPDSDFPYNRHIHMLWNVVDMDESELQRIWKKGYVDLKKEFVSVDGILNYMKKSFSTITKYDHAYNYSRNLNTKTVYRESKGQADLIDKFFDEQDLTLRYSNVTKDSKFVEESKHDFFHLKEPITHYVPVAKRKK